MAQLSELLDQLTAHKNCEAAAERDVADREHDMAHAREAVKKAQARLESARARTMNARLAVHTRIEAQTHSYFEGE